MKYISFTRSSKFLDSKLPVTRIVAQVSSFDGRELKLIGIDFSLFTEHDDDYREIRAGELWDIGYFVTGNRYTIFSAYFVPNKTTDLPS